MSKKKQPHGPKEMLRKVLVGLKRKPQIIPLIALVVTFLVYSMNLTIISNTTAKIQGNSMGLCGFATMLFSMLSMLCCSNSFPHRKPVVKPMLVLTFLMLAVVFVADFVYMDRVNSAIFREVSPIEITSTTQYIADSLVLLKAHVVLLATSVGLIITLPIYSKWIRKINTNVMVEENANMRAIEISGES